jgi:hypothetical protein
LAPWDNVVVKVILLGCGPPGVDLGLRQILRSFIELEIRVVANTLSCSMRGRRERPTGWLQDC